MTAYYGSSVADSVLTTACDMATTTGGVETSVTTSVTGGNHFCEIYSQGGNQSSQTSIGSPSGRGWIASPPGAGTYASATWTFTLTLSFASWQSGNTVTIRAYRLSSGVYNSLNSVVYTITGTAKTTYTATVTIGSTFGASDQPYFDAWLTDTSGTGGDNPTVYVSSSASAGVANDVQITTSTFTPSASAVKKDIAYLGKISALVNKDVAWYAKLALGAQKDIAWYARLSTPPAQVGVAIANSPVIFEEDTFQLHLKADERQRFQATILDYAGTATYQRGEKITVDDPTLSRLFSGVLLDDQYDKQNTYPDATVEHQIDTTGNEYFADKRTSQSFYTTPTYASSIVFDQVVNALAAEGVVAPYARRVDTTQADWAQGTLTNTIATSNVGAGDLELVNTGGAVTQSYLTQSSWSSGGTLSNVQANSGGDLSLIGFTRNWSDGSTSGQTLFGPGNPSDGVTNGQYFLSCSTKSVTDSRLDFAGTWQNGTIEVDMVLDSDTARRSMVWRQTGWNSLDDYAYALELRNSAIEVRVGHNGAGGATSQIASHTFSNALGAGTYRVRVVMNGSTFTISVNGTQYLSVSDSTYSAAGNIGLRNRNDTTIATLTDYFDNFGVMSALSGTWTSSSTSINAVTTISSSVITWDTSLSQGGTILVQSSIDSGSTYQTCSNGAVIPGLTAGVFGTGKSVIIKITLSTTTTATMPDLRNLSWTVSGGYVSSGTRVSPLLSLSPSGRIGSTLVAWNVNLPSSATTLGVDTSIDGGVTWTDVSDNNGGPIPGLNGTPEPTIDGFGSNSIANYTNTNGFGGSAATWTFDTANSRVIATGGASAILAYSTINIANIDVFCDVDESDAGGLVFCYSGPTSYYGVVVADNQASIGTKNTITLYKSQSYRATILADAPIAYYRLDDSSGPSATDSSGNAYTGSYNSTGVTYGITGSIPGESDTAVLFDGSTGQMTAPAGLSTSGWTAMSAECWFNLSNNTFGNYPGLFGNDRADSSHQGFYAILAPSGDGNKGYISLGNGSSAAIISFGGAGVFSANTWYHLVVTWDGTTLKAYINGAASYSSISTTSGGIAAASYSFAVGSYPDGSNHFPGIMDDVAIYHSTLSAAQVLNHYNTALGLNKSQLAQSAISFLRGSWHRIRATNIDGTITVSFDGTQVLSCVDSTPLSTGLAGLYQTGNYTTNWATRTLTSAVDLGITGGASTTARFYQLWLQPIGDNADGKTVLTRCRLATTDSTVTPQVLDLTVAAYSQYVNVGTLIPSADYQMEFISKVFDDLAKQSNYAWWIDQNKILNFRHRSAVPAPWILQSTSLGYVVDLEADSNLQVQIANDLFRNRQNLTGVLNVGTFTNNFQGDGQTSSFTLQYAVAPGSVPSITLNSVVQKVAEKGTTGAQFYYADTGTDPVIAQDANLTKLTSSDRLVVTYTGIFVTTVTVDNTASQTALAAQEGGSGIVEAVEDVSQRNMMYAAAVTYANQLLTRYCLSGRTITFATYKNGLQPGQILSVFLPELGLFDVQMFITAIDITMRTQPGSTIQYQYVVTASELPNIGSWAKLLASSILLT